MRTFSSTIIALIVLLTVTRVTSHTVYSVNSQLTLSRNTATIAAYVMIWANCTDVGDILRIVNATSPLPDYPASNVVVWCEFEPRVIAISWRR